MAQTLDLMHGSQSCNGHMDRFIFCLGSECTREQQQCNVCSRMMYTSLTWSKIIHFLKFPKSQAKIYGNNALHWQLGCLMSHTTLTSVPGYLEHATTVIGIFHNGSLCHYVKGVMTLLYTKICATKTTIATFISRKQSSWLLNKHQSCNALGPGNLCQISPTSILIVLKFYSCSLCRNKKGLKRTF